MRHFTASVSDKGEDVDSIMPAIIPIRLRVRVTVYCVCVCTRAYVYRVCVCVCICSYNRVYINI